jgi:hypothetical protein
MEAKNKKEFNASGIRRTSSKKGIFAVSETRTNEKNKQRF